MSQGTHNYPSQVLYQQETSLAPAKVEMTFEIIFRSNENLSWGVFPTSFFCPSDILVPESMKSYLQSAQCPHDELWPYKITHYSTLSEPTTSLTHHPIATACQNNNLSLL